MPTDHDITLITALLYYLILFQLPQTIEWLSKAALHHHLIVRALFSFSTAWYCVCSNVWAFSDPWPPSQSLYSFSTMGLSSGWHTLHELYTSWTRASRSFGVSSPAGRIWPPPFKQPSEWEIDKTIQKMRCRLANLEVCHMSRAPNQLMNWYVDKLCCNEKSVREVFSWYEDTWKFSETVLRISNCWFPSK